MVGERRRQAARASETILYLCVTFTISLILLLLLSVLFDGLVDSGRGGAAMRRRLRIVVSSEHR